MSVIPYCCDYTIKKVYRVSGQNLRVLVPHTLSSLIILLFNFVSNLSLIEDINSFFLCFFVATREKVRLDFLPDVVNVENTN